MTYLEYFIVGCLIDVVIAIGWYAMEKRLIILSMLSTVTQTAIVLTIYHNMFFSGNFTLEMITFTVGCGFGTLLVVGYKKYLWSKKFRGVKQ